MYKQDRPSPTSGLRETPLCDGVWTGMVIIITGTALFLLGETLRRGFFPHAPVLVADLLNATLVAVILTVFITLTLRRRAELLQAKRALRAREEHYRMLFNHGSEAIFVYPLQEDGTPGRFVEVNDMAPHMLGYSKEELLELWPQDLEVSSTPAYGGPPCVVNGLKVKNRVPRETSYRTKDGALVPVEVCTLFFEMNGQKMIMASARDISKRKEAQAKAGRQKTYFRQLFELCPLGIAMLDRNLQVLQANTAFEQLFHYPAAEAVGRSIYEVTAPAEASPPHPLLPGSNPMRRESVRRRKSGGTVPVSVLTYPIIIDDKQVGTYAIYEDITQRKETEEQLRYLSYYDALTGLHNRAYFEEQGLRFDAERGPAGIIVCDIDGLKLINDSLGHRAGDRLLKATADILRYSFREDDVIARIGGDEFAVLSAQGEPAVTRSAGRIRKGVDLYNKTHDKLPLSLSIGLAVRSHDSEDIRQVFKRADDNMYREKLHRSRSVRSALMQTLMKALEARDFITEGHAARMEAQITAFGRALDLPSGMINDLRLLARFHDIGKVGTPDHILFKPGPLTPEETAEMQRHSEIGYRIAQASPDLIPISDWILAHHEWWNGQGYPRGLEGKEIPLACRIISIVDAFDAMTSDRPYRKAMSVGDAVQELKRCAGTQFDPELVKVFTDMLASESCPAACTPFGAQHTDGKPAKAAPVGMPNKSKPKTAAMRGK